MAGDCITQGDEGDSPAVPFVCPFPSEIEAGVDDERPRSGGRGDASEAGRADAEVGRDGRAKVRMVQHVHGVHAQFELFGFVYPDALNQVRIKSQRRRSRDPVPAKSSDLSRSRTSIVICRIWMF